MAKINLNSIWKVVRPILTILTDALNAGRQAGLWNKGNTIGNGRQEGPKK